MFWRRHSALANGCFSTESAGSGHSPQKCRTTASGPFAACPVLAERLSKPPFGSRGEFRASAGARKSPRKLTFGYKELSVSKRTLNILPLS